MPELPPQVREAIDAAVAAAPEPTDEQIESLRAIFAAARQPQSDAA